MDDGHIWLILFSVSLCVNVVQLLWRPILALLHRKDQVSEDNIRAMVEEGEESGAIQSNEKEFIENVFEFDNTTARDVMVHRTDMATLSVEAGEEEILEVIRQSGLSRFPVYGEDADDILGILSTRDYLLNFHQSAPLPLKELLRPAYFVPETVAADVLFRDMQGKKTHMALVVDEYGGTSGLVTLEDLLEELVGNIYDEFDPQEEQEIIQLEGDAGGCPAPPTWRNWPRPWASSCPRTRRWTTIPWADWSSPSCRSSPRTAAVRWWRPWGSTSRWRSCATAGWSGLWWRS